MLFCYLSDTYWSEDIYSKPGMDFKFDVNNVCLLSWKFGAFYCIAFTIIKTYVLLNKGMISLIKFIFYTLILYCITLVCTGPYLPASFFQFSLLRHTLLHFVMIELILEWVYRKYFHL